MVSQSNGQKLNDEISYLGSISEDFLKKCFEFSSKFFVDVAGKTLDAAATSKTTDGGLRHTLKVGRRTKFRLEIKIKDYNLHHQAKRTQ
jgi:hypothetical protein